MAACGSSASTKTSSRPTVAEESACAQINNEALGVFKKLPAGDQTLAVNVMIGDAKKSGNATMRSRADRMQKDASGVMPATVNSDVSDLAQVCTSLGIGPNNATISSNSVAAGAGSQ
jgi:hypothetical protein